MNKIHSMKTILKQCIYTKVSKAFSSFALRSPNPKQYPQTYGCRWTLPARSKSGSVKYQHSTLPTIQKASSSRAPSDLVKQFRALGETYTTAQAKHISWNTHVNLAPPTCWNGQSPQEDEHIWSYYNSLQYTLFETGYPETVDRTHAPRTEHNKAQVAVAILASPFECVGILLEGGRQLSDSFHLILSPTWLTRVPSRKDPKISELYIHKAITFGHNGASYIDEFVVPRLVTYFMNYFTEAITGGQRADGTHIEENINCPISSSVPLANLIDDRLWTRRIMAEVGMATPMTLGLMYKPQWKPPMQEEKNMTFTEITDADMYDTNYVEGEIVSFLGKLLVNGTKKVVVKPSGPKFYGSIGVSFHAVEDVTEIQSTALSLLKEIEPANSVLIESFEESFTPNHTASAPQWSADDTLGFRIKVTVCRSFTDKPVTSKITCVMGPKDSPINGDNGISQTLDSTLISLGVEDACERQRLYASVCRQSEAVLQGIINEEKREFQDGTLVPGAQTDLIGIDMVITRRHGQLTPVGIEVNSYDCTINCQIAEFMSSLFRRLVAAPREVTQTGNFGQEVRHKPDVTANIGVANNTNAIKNKDVTANVDGTNWKDVTANINVTNNTNASENKDVTANKHIDTANNKHVTDNIDADKAIDFMASECKEEGISVRPLVQTMLHRSQKHLMRGKKVVVIGAGGFSKRNIWIDADKYGIEVILVESNKNHFAKDFVSQFIHYDLDDHKQDTAHALNIVNILRDCDVTADGCVTFWEDCVPLAALICEILGVNGSTVTAARTAKKKSCTQLAVAANNEDIPHWPRPHLYSSNVHCLNGGQDIDNGNIRVEFPAILKLEHGSSAVGVALVDNKDALRRKYTKISESLRSESDYAGVGLGHDNSMFVSDYHVGSEHDVDLVMFDRKPIAAFISDNGPTRVPLFTETTAMMPSGLPVDKQAQLVTAAVQSCTELGLSDGTFNVELKMTSTGPKLIEINARMGGFYLREWISKLYGVDIMLCSFIIACGIQPYIPQHNPDSCIMGVMLLPSLHAHIFDDISYKKRLDALHDKGDILWTQFAETAEIENMLHEEPIGNISVQGKTPEEARHKLLAICKELKIATSGYHVSDFLNHFKTIKSRQL